MDTGYFQSKAFVIAAILAGLILVAGVGAYAWSDSPLGATSSAACDAPRGAPAPDETFSSSSATSRDRTVAWTMNATSAAAGRMELCTAVGDITVNPSPDDMTHVTFHIHARTADAIVGSVVRAALVDGPEGPRIFAWEERTGRGGTLFGSSTASADLEVLVPANAPYDLHATSDVGDLSVGAVLLGNLTLGSSVGDIAVRGADVLGNTTLESDVGDVHHEPASVASGKIVVTTSTGDITLRLPSRVDVGYDATGESDVGDVTVRIGETQTYEKTENTPGARVHAVSRDYAAKPTRVVVDVTSDVGDITIDAR